MSHDTRITSAAHARAVLALGLPLIGSHLAQLLLHVTDTVLMGWYGVTELAAMVLGGSFFFSIFILGAGFGQAVMGMVAAAIGRGDEVQVRRDARMGMWLSIVFGVLCYPLFWWSGGVLRALGQNGEVAALAQGFLRVAGLGMIPALLVMTLKSYLAALERTQVVLWITLAALPLNFVIAYALIFGRWGMPEMGVVGAAIASVSMQFGSFVAMAFYAAWVPALQRFHLWQRFWRPDWHAFVQVFRLGMPIGVTGVAESGLFQAAALMMGWIGTEALAAHGIAMQVVALSFMFHLGLSNAVTVRTGRAEGAGDFGGLRDGAKVAIGLSFAFGLVMVVLFLTMPGPILMSFLDTSQPKASQIIALGTTLLALAALFQIADAMQVMALGLLRGVRDTKVPMTLAAVSYWGVGLPVSYVLAFPLGQGAVGLWLGLTIGLAAAASSLMLRFWSRLPRG